MHNSTHTVEPEIWVTIVKEEGEREMLLLQFTASKGVNGLNELLTYACWL